MFKCLLGLAPIINGDLGNYIGYLAGSGNFDQDIEITEKKFAC